jgi:two-component system, chemotaxis family, CheB/CheR fusion protein
MAKQNKRGTAGGSKQPPSRRRPKARRKPAAARRDAVAGHKDGAKVDSDTGSRRTPGATTESKPGFAVVGIGASAGGLEAFKRLFSALPSEPGMAFVLIQHLDPTHQSLTSELLGRQTAMPVIEATDDLQIEPNHVYVIPPNKYLAISGDKLRLSEPTERRGLRLPVDFFFRSLAQDQQQRAIAILLSGTGSDGTHGVREIKVAGGMVMAQQPETTEWPGMPQSAIASGVVDYILPVEQMPRVLKRYVKHWYVNGPSSPETPVEKEPDYLKDIVGILRTRAKYDFSSYKRGTLMRRIQRRMGLNHLHDLQAYLGHLRRNKDEATALFKDMLISVTSFFREPKAWEALDQLVITGLFAGRGADQPIRVWVPGCATGEEAYSLAMLLLSHAQKHDRVFDLHIFASDIDQDALAFARAGVYPESVAADVPRDLLRRYFIKGAHTYRVCKELRDLVVFAEQNVISDPPFSKLDLITCRNLLIYLEPDAQKKILALFHFSLRQGGYLFLGRSEAVNQQVTLFEPVAPKLQLYRRLGDVRDEHLGLPSYPVERLLKRTEPLSENRGTRARPLAALAQQILLQRFAPACALINRKLNVMYLHGAVDHYLQLPDGAPAADLAAMAREGLRAKLRAAIQRAIRENRRINMPGISVKRDHSGFTARVTVEPLKNDNEPDGLLLVIFEQEHDTNEPSASPPSGADPSVPAPSTESEYELIIGHLEEHLRTTRDDLQRTIEDLEASNEDSKAANEEITSVNEELQSTNEELETSKEELQSLNEEMQTVNHQLEQKVDELETANNDLDNLLSITEVATILLDRRFCLKRFTRATQKLLRVIESDVGRPISDFAQNFTDPHLMRDAKEVLDKLTPLAKEIQDHDGRTYLRRIVPYRAEEERVDGVVITFTDVSDRKEREQALQNYSAQLEQEVARRTVQLDQLAREMANLAEQERQNLGRQLHDTLGQQITAIGVLAATLKEHRESGSDRNELADKLETSIQEAKRQTRALTKGLFPVDVDAQGLRIALEELAKETTAIFRISCRFECNEPISIDNNFMATQLFLIAREAVQNSARHAKATEVVIKLRDSDGIWLSVEDNGKGLPEEIDGNAGMGLRIMRHRVDLIGGKLELDSRDRQGTRVTLHVSRTK